MSRLPNFLYIGTCKAGSTWLYDVLARHPDIYMAPGKGLYFFSRNYDRGFDWYRSQFANAGGERVIGEVSHTYMYTEAVCERIAEMNPEIRLMVCLREPVDRAFADYLDGVKNGLIHGDFETELAGGEPAFLDRSRYARYLAPYVARFGRDSIHVSVFDELAANPNQFAQRIFAFLGIEEWELPPAQRKKMMPAGKPRSQLLAGLAKKASRGAMALGLRGVRGRFKTSRRVRNLLYRPFSEAERPSLRLDTLQRLREDFRKEVLELDALLGTTLRRTWEYE